MKRALLVIDAQKVYTSAESALFCPDSAATIVRVNKLIEKFQLASEPVFYVRHVHQADGSDLGRMFDFAGNWDGQFNFKAGTVEVEYDDRLLVPSGAAELTKARYSCFANTDLDGDLRKLAVNTVTICGFMTNFCCESTARHAHNLDYYVDFVLDATGNPGTESMNEDAVRKAVGDFMRGGFARVLSASDY